MILLASSTLTVPKFLNSRDDESFSYPTIDLGLVLPATVSVACYNDYTIHYRYLLD